MTLAETSEDSWNWKPTLEVTQGLTASLAPDPTYLPRKTLSSYDARGNLKTIVGQLTGALAMTRASVGSSHSTAAPPTASINNSFVTLAQYTPDPAGTGNVVRIQQPGTSQCKDLTYDPVFSHLLSARTVHVNGCNDTGLTTTYNNYVRGLGLLTSWTTPSNAETLVTYEAYGRVKAINLPSPRFLGLADSTAETTLAYNDNVSPRTVETTITDGTTANTISTWTSLDGFGRPAMKASPGDSAAGGPCVISQVARNWRGDAYVQLPPTPVATACQAVTPPGLSGSSRATQYDAFGRAVSATDLDTTVLFHRTYGALAYTEVNAYQWATGSTNATTVAFDGHGRRASVKQTGNGGTLTTAFVYQPTGEPQVVLRAATDGSGQYGRLMMYDSLGRLVLNAEPNTSVGLSAAVLASLTPGTVPAGLQAWMYAYDDAGHLVATTDARGCGENFFYDGAGRPTYEDYFGCTANHVPYTPPNPTTGAGAEVFRAYDAEGRLTDAYDRASHTAYSYDGRNRVTAIHRNLVQPGVTPTPQSGYAEHTFVQELHYDALNRLIGETTGEDEMPAYLQGSSVTFPDTNTSSTSAVTLQYSGRNLLQSVGGSYGSLIQQATYNANGSAQNTTLGDIAGTTTAYTYDARQRLYERKTSRVAPGMWASPGPSYSPPPLSPVTTTQTVLEDDVYTLDANGNPRTITDNRLSPEWQAAPGASPVTRGIGYDDFDRVTSVTYSYANSNAYISPTATGSAVSSPFPLLAPAGRVTQETAAYNLLGDRTSTTDDENLFFDRSLGKITLSSAGSRLASNQIQSATLGSATLTTNYDASGNLLRLNVVRPGGCESGSGCNQLFDYEWDEVGQLMRARRYDFAGGETCGILALASRTAMSIPHNPPVIGPPTPPIIICTPNPLPTGTPLNALPTQTAAVDVQFAYNDGGARVLRTSSVDGASATYTADIFASLRLQDTTFGEQAAGDYDRSVATDQVSLVAGGQVFGRIVNGPLGYDPVTSANVLYGQHVFLELGDHLGSTKTVIDQATSELVEQTTFSAFGRVESDYRPARWQGFREPFKFTGKEDDVALGVTYFGARYYSPYLGVWMSADPAAIHALAADLNPYAYVHGHAFAATDPFGLCEQGQQCVDPTVPYGPPPPNVWQNIGNWFKGIGNGISGWFHHSGASPQSVPQPPSSGGGWSSWSQGSEAAYQQSKAQFGPQGSTNPLIDGIDKATPMAAAVMSQYMPVGPAFSVTREIEQTIADAAEAAEAEAAARSAAAADGTLLQRYLAGAGGRWGKRGDSSAKRTDSEPTRERRIYGHRWRRQSI